MCRKIAQETGVLVDPMYTLAAWETATELVEDEDSSIVVMLHTGGTLGMFGLAQRYKSFFTNLKHQECNWITIFWNGTTWNGGFH